VSLAYVLGEDWSGHPAIFFRIVLSEEASRCDRLLKATNQIEDVVRDGIQQLEQWGVLPYFTYRSPSEQAARNDQAWP
jgi:hypothetical protein